MTPELEMIDEFRKRKNVPNLAPLCVYVTQAEFDAFLPLYESRHRMIIRDEFRQRQTVNQKTGKPGPLAWWVSCGPGLIVKEV